MAHHPARDAHQRPAGGGGRGAGPGRAPATGGFPAAGPRAAARGVDPPGPVGLAGTVAGGFLRCRTGGRDGAAGRRNNGGPGGHRTGTRPHHSLPGILGHRTRPAAGPDSLPRGSHRGNGSRFVPVPSGTGAGQSAAFPRFRGGIRRGRGGGPRGATARGGTGAAYEGGGRGLGHGLGLAAGRGVRRRGEREFGPERLLRRGNRGDLGPADPATGGRGTRRPGTGDPAGPESGHPAFRARPEDPSSRLLPAGTRIPGGLVSSAGGGELRAGQRLRTPEPQNLEQGDLAGHGGGTHRHGGQHRGLLG